METTNDAYKPLLQFLKNSCLYVALTKQPSAYYPKYLREFWYTAEANTASKSITFTLSHFDKPLSFNLDTFSSVIGLDRRDEFVDIPPKETVKVGIATLGLVDEDHPSLSSSDLINSSSMKGSYNQLNANQQTIAYCLCWGLDIDIADNLFSELCAHLHPEASKNQRKSNVSFIMEHLLQDNYKNDKLLYLKPFHITAITFKPTWKNETALTSHMCKLVTQFKAPTAKRPRKKKIPSSTQSDVLKSSRISKSSSIQATHLQPAEEFVVTTDATKSLEASESAEVLDQNIVEEEDVGVHSLKEPTFEQLMDEVDNQKKAA
ncbi:hypothetical protein Tco_0802626 [Tanacetum coccineum]|uniref:Uncharacterized protein n=1 Tax=Tanacetum coccineum TaxID=301880 RepID=A0ABQ5A3I7_9ASTR